MLDLIRNNIQSFGVKFIVAIVVLVMVFFGVTAYQSQGINTIATIDGYEIKVERYQRAFDQAQNEIRQRYQARAADYMKMIDLPSQIVQQLVNTVLLIKNAEKNGLVVTDQELAQAIFSNPAFLTDERFDEKKYTQMLSQNRLDRLIYEQELRENLLTRKYIEFLISGGLVSRQRIDTEFDQFNTEVDIRLLEIVPAVFFDQITISDDDIKAYYEAHPTEFQQKKQFTLKYFILNTDDVQEKIVVREKEIERYYQRNKDTEFTSKASFHARHILIPIPEDGNEAGMKVAREKAEKIHQQLTQNRQSFETLARQHSADSVTAAKGGDLGWVDQGVFVEEFEQAVAPLKKNELSQPFLSQFGYHIAEILDRKPAVVRSQQEVTKEIEAAIHRGKAERRLESKVETLVKGLAQRPLAEAASAYAKEIKTTPAFDDSADLPDIGYSYQLYQTIKSKKAEESGSYALGSGKGILIYQVAEVTEPFTKPLESVKETVAVAVREEKALQTAAEKVKAWGTSVANRAQFDQVARELKTTPQALKFKLSDRQAGQIPLSDEFRGRLLKLQKENIAAVSEGNRHFLIQLVDKSLKSDPVKDRDLYQGIESYLKKQKASLLLGEFIQQMKNEVEVEYNQTILNALNIQFRE